MEIDAGLRRRILVSLAAAATFVAGLLAIGAAFDGSSLPEAGALALVGLLAGFVLLMALVGTYLIRTDADAADDA